MAMAAVAELRGDCGGIRIHWVCAKSSVRYVGSPTMGSRLVKTKPDLMASALGALDVIVEFLNYLELMNDG